MSAVTALGLSVAIPMMALASTGIQTHEGYNRGNANTHVHALINGHVNEHTSILANVHVNSHVNAHVNEHVNVHVNAHTNTHANSHVNAHVNEHVNAHVNAHTNTHANSHVNAHVNAHVNEHTNVHVNTHTNIHTNVHANVHAKVGATTGLSSIQNQLLTSIQSLHVTDTAFLYAYMLNLQLTEKDVLRVQHNVHEIDAICGHAGTTATLSVSQRNQVWWLYQNTLAILQLHATVTNHAGHLTSPAHLSPNQTTVLHIEDTMGHQLASAPMQHPTTASTYSHLANAVANTTNAAHRLPVNGKSATPGAGALPQTATADPLMIAIGLLLSLLGGLGLLTVRRTSRGSRMGR